MTQPMPPHARRLIEDAEANGCTVTTDWGEGYQILGVNITDTEGNEFRAAWMPYRGGLRYRYGHDGWQELTLTALRSFVTR